MWIIGQYTADYGFVGRPYQIFLNRKNMML